MLNDEDVKQFDKLLTLVKNSSSLKIIELLYHHKKGWCIYVHTENDGWYDEEQFKRKRLGEVCVDKVVELVQERLNGDA